MTEEELQRVEFWCSPTETAYGHPLSPGDALVLVAEVRRLQKGLAYYSDAGATGGQTRAEMMADAEDDESGPVAAEDRFTLKTLTAMGFPFSGTREEKAAWMASAPMFTGGRTAKELLDEAYIVAMSGGNPTRAVLFGGNALLGGQMDTYRVGTPDESTPESGEDQRR